MECFEGLKAFQSSDELSKHSNRTNELLSKISRHQQVEIKPIYLILCSNWKWSVTSVSAIILWNIFTFSCVANERKLISISYNCVEISSVKRVPWGNRREEFSCESLKKSANILFKSTFRLTFRALFFYFNFRLSSKFSKQRILRFKGFWYYSNDCWQPTSDYLRSFVLFVLKWFPSKTSNWSWNVWIYSRKQKARKKLLCKS